MRFGLGPSFDDEDDNNSEIESTNNTRKNVRKPQNNSELVLHYRDPSELIGSDSESDSDDDEPPHPLGFSSTRYGYWGKLVKRKPLGTTTTATTSHHANAYDLNRMLKDAQYSSFRYGVKNREQSFPAVFGVPRRTAHPEYIIHQITQQCMMQNSLEKEKGSGAENLACDREKTIDQKIRSAFSGLSILSNSSKISSSIKRENEKLDDEEIEKLMRELQEQQLEHELLVKSTICSPFSKKNEEKKDRSESRDTEAFYQRISDKMRILLKKDEEYAKQILEREKREEAEAEAEAKAVLREKEKQKEEEELKKKLEREKEEASKVQDAENAKITQPVQTDDTTEKNPPLSTAATVEVSSVPEIERPPLMNEQKMIREPPSKPEYIEKALEQVRKLEKVRRTIQPFEKSKLVSKRRLQMKKVVRGKLNTLNTSPDKIKEVAKEILAATKQAKEDDAIHKNDPNFDKETSPELALGKRYLLDLLASTIVVRVQAESFNGLKGDGFALAHVIVILSEYIKEIPLLVEAHFYTACPPCCIPAIPTIGKDVKEDEFMEALGMKKSESSGEFETFDQYLTRMQNLVSVLAAMICSRPSSHNNVFRGNKGAIQFLRRFLDQIPEKNLPLLTAPVLVAFLTVAGHMMANKFITEFKQILNEISDRIIPNLDQGEFGAPSATRLKKLVVDQGFDWFSKNLPEGCIASLYSGADASHKPEDGSTENKVKVGANTQFVIGQGGKAEALDEPTTTTTTTSNSNNNPFSQSSPSPFNAYPPPSFTNSSSRPPCKFFARGNCRNGANCPFSHEMPGGMNAMENNDSVSFGTMGDGNVGNTSNPFNSGMNNTSSSNSNPFSNNNTSNNNNNPFSQSSTTQSTISSSSPSPFSNNTGMNNNNNMNAAGGGFGFGFGNNTNNTQKNDNPSPFSSGNSNTPMGGTTGFGNSTTSSNNNPFASTASKNNSIASSPFGGRMNTPNNNNMNSASGSGFGFGFGNNNNSNNNANKNPSPFSAGNVTSGINTSMGNAFDSTMNNNTNMGGTNSTTTKNPFSSFSQNTSSPFAPRGGAVNTNNNPSPFTSPAPIGGKNPFSSSPSPFVNNNNNKNPSPFSNPGSIISNNPFGTYR